MTPRPLLGRLLCLALAMAWGAPVNAAVFQATLDESSWTVEASPLSCKLNHPIPRWGEARFETQAGEPGKFVMTTLMPVRQSGSVKLESMAPQWHDGVATQPLGTATFQAGSTPVELPESTARQFLAELQRGLQPAMVMPTGADGQPLRIALSSARFQKAYPEYLSCVTALYPANFDQLKASRLTYRNDQWRPDDSIRKRLDLIVGFLPLDSGITKILVDGHSDRVGRQGHNWEISRLRAQAVKDYLVSKGVAEEMVLMNYYGETRLLVKTVNNIPNQSNRRVTVQLVKSP